MSLKGRADAKPSSTLGGTSQRWEGTAPAHRASKSLEAAARQLLRPPPQSRSWGPGPAGGKEPSCWALWPAAPRGGSEHAPKAPAHAHCQRQRCSRQQQRAGAHLAGAGGAEAAVAAQLGPVQGEQGQHVLRRGEEVGACSTEPAARGPGRATAAEAPPHAACGLRTAAATSRGGRGHPPCGTPPGTAQTRRSARGWVGGAGWGGAEVAGSWREVGRAAWQWGWGGGHARSAAHVFASEARLPGRVGTSGMPARPLT